MAKIAFSDEFKDLRGERRHTADSSCWYVEPEKMQQTWLLPQAQEILFKHVSDNREITIRTIGLSAPVQSLD
jgi:hypothetical protein